MKKASHWCYVTTHEEEMKKASHWCYVTTHCEAKKASHWCYVTTHCEATSNVVVDVLFWGLVCSWSPWCL
jgi:hypothetical protein